VTAALENIAAALIQLKRKNFLLAKLKALCIAPVLCPVLAFSQQAASPMPADTTIQLDVTVTNKAGLPVTGKTQQDFTVLDNKAQQPITSFQAVDHGEAPAEVIILIDGINTPDDRMAYVRDQVVKFLHGNGKLMYPTALAFATDKGTQIQADFTKDGNNLADVMAQYVIDLQAIRNISGAFYGAMDRFQKSIDTLHLLIEHEGPRPGRKIVIWVSSGWPLLTGPNVSLDAKQENQLFGDVVNFSTLMRRARMTMYSIDPLGTDVSGSTHDFYYQDFLKPVTKPGQVEMGNLALQVLAVHSGGLVLNSSNDTAALLQRCIDDTQSYYEISFSHTPVPQNIEYHRIEVKVSDSKQPARTIAGYYALPPSKK
jgi:VWFA-related protein